MNVYNCGRNSNERALARYMQHTCSTIAALALKLKRQYQVVLGASPAYGHDKNMTQQIDALGLLIKELADAVVVLQLKLEKDQDSTLLAGQN